MRNYKRLCATMKGYAQHRVVTWVHGWVFHIGAFIRCLKKGHGVGYTIRTAWLCASCARYVIDGQHRGAPEPISGLRAG